MSDVNVANFNILWQLVGSAKEQAGEGAQCLRPLRQELFDWYQLMEAT